MGHFRRPQPIRRVTPRSGLEFLPLLAMLVGLSITDGGYAQAQPLLASPFLSFDVRNPGTPTHVAVGDLNGDGWPDVVVADSCHPAYSS